MRSDTLYSFRRCPYAMRARWALINCGEDVTIREVSLKSKPRELVRISPKATVPVLLINTGEIIDESLDIMLWAIRRSNRKIARKVKKSNTKPEVKLLIEENDKTFKFHLDRYKYPKRYENIDKDLHQNTLTEILIKWNSLISTSANGQSNGWLVEDSETLADWALWPFVRQFRMVDPDGFDSNQEFSNLKMWLKFYTDNILFEKLMTKFKPWEQGDDENTYLL